MRVDESDPEQREALIGAVSSYYSIPSSAAREAADHGPRYGVWASMRDRFLESHPDWKPSDWTAIKEAPVDHEWLRRMTEDNRHDRDKSLATIVFGIVAILALVYLIMRCAAQ